ncbi:Lacal_2735 family protein [bacterium]|nr:Lacal_2735 family protein [bacterium]
MFGIFKKKSQLEKLQDRYKKLMSEWHELSTTNRSASDLKYVEAQKLLDEIDKLNS